MSARSFLYGLWCLIVAGLFLASTYYAWSPFADGGRAPIGLRGSGGPNHK